MTNYLMSGSKEDDYSTIYATHPALDGTYICYPFKDGSVSKAPVILWAVLSNGSPEPIALGGIWNGTETQANMFVRFPDGRCARGDTCWDTEQGAADDLRQYDSSE